jgi:hypothetical protein
MRAEMQVGKVKDASHHGSERAAVARVQ